MSAKKGRGEQVEGAVLVLILLIVGGLAGAASFTHVHDWTMDNSPAGTGDWFGWANAAISELIPLAALLTIRRRRRVGSPVGYPMTLLVAAVALSLSAQLAVAKPGLSGWLLSAVPSLAFLGLSKLVLSAKPAAPSPDSAGRDEQAAARYPDSTASIVGDGDRPGAVPEQANAEDEPDGGKQQPDGGQAVSVDLVQLARRHATEHLAATGRPITRDELRAALRVANGTASDLLRLIRESERPAVVPVPATAFASRNGVPLTPSAPSETAQ